MDSRVRQLEQVGSRTVLPDPCNRGRSVGLESGPRVPRAGYDCTVPVDANPALGDLHDGELAVSVGSLGALVPDGLDESTWPLQSSGYATRK